MERNIIFMKHIYLIRHGQTNWNLEGRLQGILDIPLNNAGKTQALFCAQAFQKIEHREIFTSPLSRALETAQIISQNTFQSCVIPNHQLIERDYGPLTGLLYEEIKNQYPDYPHILPKNMEDFESLSHRIYEGILECTKFSVSENTLIISHGGAINAFLFYISNGTIGTGITKLNNTCICDLLYDQTSHSFSILSYNQSPENFLPH